MPTMRFIGAIKVGVQEGWETVFFNHSYRE